MRTRIAEPLGLPHLHLGLPPTGDAAVADLVWVGERPSAEDYSALGLEGFNATTGSIQEDGVPELSEIITRRAGSPCAGAVSPTRVTWPCSTNRCSTAGVPTTAPRCGSPPC